MGKVKTGKERYLEKVRRLDGKYGIKHHRQLDKKENYPYKGYSKLKRQVLKRDNYTCQNCGYEAPEREREWTECIHLRGFHPHGEWAPPRFCPLTDKSRPKTCSVCENYSVFKKKFRSTSSLVAHHIDHDPCNNSLENLMTLRFMP